MDGRKIVKARITKMPERMLDPMPEVIATLEDGSEEVLFSYYPDEISFVPAEFAGLTVDEGRRLKYQKDLAYLQS